jgi:hypothetical protein
MLWLNTTVSGDLFFQYSSHSFSTATEYIRLVGFGSAAGLLAEKGMPGFSFLGAKNVEKPEDLANE